MEYPKFKVCCRCFAFNQAKYITDAMNGFTMQQTSFPFVCTIVDDASTDGEQDVIRKYVEDNFDFSEGSVSYHKESDYAHITYAQHKTNKNCYFAVLYLKENHYSQRKPKMGYLSEWRDMCEYEALCEGDDYWIVPDKLEKQVSFLDNNIEYSCCYHNCYYKKQNQLNAKNLPSTDEDTPIDTIIYSWAHIPTNSLLYRKCLINEEYKSFSSSCSVGDGPLEIFLAHKGRVRYFSIIMSVYRVNSQGSWSETIAKDKSKALAHYNNCIEWLRFADIFTQYEYTDAIKKSIERYKFFIIHLNLTRDFFRMIKIKEYRDYFNGFSLMNRIKFIINYLLGRI